MTDREKVIQALDCCLDKVRPGAWASECIACPYVEYDKCMDSMIQDALAMIKEQQRIIEQYQKADGFLFAHGWKWENYIDTQEEAHPIEVGEDGLPY